MEVRHLQSIQILTMSVGDARDAEEIQYFTGIKDRAYLWLAERCLAGEPQFKASDVKEKFLSTSSTIIEEVCKALVTENKAVVEGRGRVSVYVLDFVKARKFLPEVEAQHHARTGMDPPAAMRPIKNEKRSEQEVCQVTFNFIYLDSKSFTFVMIGSIILN